MPTSDVYVGILPFCPHSAFATFHCKRADGGRKENSERLAVAPSALNSPKQSKQSNRFDSKMPYHAVEEKEAGNAFEAAAVEAADAAVAKGAGPTVCIVGDGNAAHVSLLASSCAAVPFAKILTARVHSLCRC